MMTKSKIKSLLNVSLAVGAIVLMNGIASSINAQNRDPFAQPGWAKPVNPNPNPGGKPKADKPKPVGPPPVSIVLAPSIEQRIAYYKNLRESAAINGQELPKVTSVLTLDEMAVIGIFRTPRGYAAMVEAKPIKLSYTIYPGEKFFDGQLVAIEENRLVFRKVTKMSNNKFTSSVENKTLRQYTVEQEVQGTAPVQQSATTVKTEEPAAAQQQTVLVPKDGQTPNATAAPSAIVSPLDEMNRQPVEDPKKAESEKAAKGKQPAKKVKKPVKVADNKKSETKDQ